MQESCSWASSRATRRTGRACPSWQLRGKRRLHKTPAQREIECVKPHVVVALGATAARAVIAREFKVQEAAFSQLAGDLKLIRKALARP